MCGEVTTRLALGLGFVASLHHWLCARYIEWRCYAAMLELGMGRMYLHKAKARTGCRAVYIHCRRLFRRSSQRCTPVKHCTFCFFSCLICGCLELVTRRPHSLGRHSFLLMYSCSCKGFLMRQFLAVCCQPYAGAKQIPLRRMWRSLRTPALWPEAAVGVPLSRQLGCQLCIRQRVWVVMREEGSTLQSIRH